MKYIITCDTHLGRKSDNTFEIKQTSDFFDWIIDISKERSIDSFIHLGDWNNNRRSIATTTLVESTNILNKMSAQFKDTYIVAGNHDLYYKNDVHPNSIEIFDYIKTPDNHNIHIIEYPTVVNNIVLLPWLINDEHYDDVVKNNYSVDYAMGHLAINDVIMNRSKTLSKNQHLNISDFKNYKLVLSGHYHQYGEYGNIVYIGAPYHMDFNDSGVRGIYIFDSESGEMEFIEYTKAPKYIIVDAENYDDGLIPGNNVKIEFYNNIGLNEINQIIENVNCLNPNTVNVSYKFSATFTKPEENDTVEEIKGNKEMLINYIKESDIPKNLNIETFNIIIESLEK